MEITVTHKLINACPSCLSEIPFLLSDSVLSEPFTCKCGFKLANFTETYWSEWNFPVNITDNSVSEWIEGKARNDDTRFVFIPRSVSIEDFSLEPIIKSKYFYEVKQTSAREYTNCKTFNDEIYFENKCCFRTIDRFIKKKFLKKHRICALTLQELRKQEVGEFPPICPFAYAYVFWKHTLLQTTHFHKVIKGDETNSRKYLGLELATQLIEKIIIETKNKLIEHMNLFEVNREILHWIIKRITSELCLNYFYHWLEISTKGTEQIRVPNWNQVRMMLEKSIPKIIFKLSEVGNKKVIEVILQNETKKKMMLEKSIPKIIFKLSEVGNKKVIEVILQNETKKKTDINCVISSKSIKKSLRKMKSFTSGGNGIKFLKR
ncbi:hypothetical protein P5G65_29820 [Paenibacillus chondroitinus]|uniref:Uncharacterized protein n=1 Tax=Paenibacillus chondroitinus TaxID=59842 RepID=A0ABU6DMP5_9BACL|nr:MULTISPECIES: hypothetical protein [Paenibacillus]MCY9660709.1 hypothetical protein [Paenibacillus anseongense]MEB4798111.1 hypothetical protein [Paenibacillus chondroitinus]